MCLLDQSGVTGGGLDPNNHYNACFVCKHRPHVDGKIWKSTIVLLCMWTGEQIRKKYQSCHLKTISQNKQKSNQHILGINMNIHTKY